MTRTEFDSQIRELKNKKGAAIREIAAMQSEIKEEIASKHRQIDEIHKDISKLNQSLQGYHQRRIALENEWSAKVNAFIRENEWSAKVNAFIRENEPSTTSNLAEATTLNIVYELRRRGFGGIVSKVDDETGDNESYDLDKNDWNQEETNNTDV
jgi:chromosome segregation ATPase